MAIKVLREEHEANPGMVARFLREGIALRTLNHPHLVRVHDFVVEGDTLAVVMEFIDGADLRQAHQRGTLDEDTAFSVLAQVAGALAHIHAASVLHRDVKPENILLTRRDGTAWASLTDFGLAWIAGSTQLTRNSQVVGTPAYLAPEVLTNRESGAAADVYALGVTAYELFTGRRPFDASHPLALMRAHIEDEPPRPPDMDERLWRIIRACLAKRPEDRPTAADLALRYDNLFNGIDDEDDGFDAPGDPDRAEELDRYGEVDDHGEAYELDGTGEFDEADGFESLGPRTAGAHRRSANQSPPGGMLRTGTWRLSLMSRHAKLRAGAFVLVAVVGLVVAQVAWLYAHFG